MSGLEPRATGIVVTNAVPVNGFYVPGGSLAEGVVSWNVGAVPPGGSVNAAWVVSTCQLGLTN
jgi:hypothetical protein